MTDESDVVAPLQAVGAVDLGCQYSYPSCGEYGVQYGTVLRCEQPTNGRLFNWPVGAEDAIQARVCEMHADMLSECLQDATSVAPSEASQEGDPQ